MIPFNAEQYARLTDGTKRSTIRRGIRKIVPGPNIAACGEHLALIQVSEVSFRQYNSLGTAHAIAEGYASLFELRQVLEAIYHDPPLRGTDHMTIVSIAEVLWAN